MSPPGWRPVCPEGLTSSKQHVHNTSTSNTLDHVPGTLSSPQELRGRYTYKTAIGVPERNARPRGARAARYERAAPFTGSVGHDMGRLRRRESSLWTHGRVTRGCRMGAEVPIGVLGARSFTARSYGAGPPLGAHASRPRSGRGRAARRRAPQRRGRASARSFGQPSSARLERTKNAGGGGSSERRRALNCRRRRRACHRVGWDGRIIAEEGVGRPSWLAAAIALHACQGRFLHREAHGSSCTNLQYPAAAPSRASTDIIEAPAGSSRRV